MSDVIRKGLETIEQYTGDTRHPNGVWDAHVIAGRLLRGEDQNGRAAPAEPIPLRIVCPECGEYHIDEGEFATKPHHTHACQQCGNVWRPAIVNTVGVRFLPGFKNSP